MNAGNSNRTIGKSSNNTRHHSDVAWALAWPDELIGIQERQTRLEESSLVRGSNNVRFIVGRYSVLLRAGYISRGEVRLRAPPLENRLDELSEH